MAAGDLLTADQQLEWRGVLLGAGTTITTARQGIQGLEDLPAVRASGSVIEGWHGSFPTRILLDRRYITWNYQIAAPVTASRAAVDELSRITTLPDPGPSAPEEPLAIQIAGRKVLVHGQVMRRVIPGDLHARLGVVRGAVQWVCADPNVYTLPQRSEPTGLPIVGSGGLVFPLVFPLDFGTSSIGGVITLDNPGSVDAWPLLRVTGPAPGPTITDLDRGFVLRFSSTWTLPAGQTIEIDTRPGYRTVLFTPSGVSADQHLITSQWFSVPAGSTGLRVGFSAGSYDAAAQLRALWYPTAH